MQRFLQDFLSKIKIYCFNSRLLFVSETHSKVCLFNSINLTNYHNTRVPTF